MSHYYNEIDPFAVQWLRNLIKAGLIPQGDVDERSIVDVRGSDLRGYEQCHFFAGIGGWAYALQLAGWEGEVWTGSCPCQPFSVAGSGKGTADERHLWPAFRRLIEECGPPVVFGEQVASEAGRTWLTGVRADLEELGYACGAADLCAASVTAPHIRQRLYWVAESSGVGYERAGGARRGRAGFADNRADGGLGDAHVSGRKALELFPIGTEENGRAEEASRGTGTHGLADAERDGGRADFTGRRQEGRAADGRTREGIGRLADHDHDGPHRTGGVATVTDSDEQDGRLHRGSAGRVDHAEREGLEGFGRDVHNGDEPGRQRAEPNRPIATAGIRGGLGVGDTNGSGCREDYRSQPPRGGAPADIWSPFEVIACGDGKSRRVAPGLPLLAHGFPKRVGLLRGFGNAIVPPLAAEFVQAFMEIDAR